MLRFSLCLSVLLLSLLSLLSDARLISVQLASRHGTRAPNPVVVDLCPGDRNNLEMYEQLRISLAGLTGKGMRELYELGVYSRQTYIETVFPGFLHSYFDNMQVYFRAVGEDRTIQSAVAMGQAMYPAGRAAVGYLDGVPSPIPVYTIPDKYDNLLECRKAGCKNQLQHDVDIYDATVGQKDISSHQAMIAAMAAICNVTSFDPLLPGSGDNLGDAIKDITDAWTFDFIQEFKPQPGLNLTNLLEFRTYAVKQLIGRILGTEDQITYLNGQLPETLVSNFKKSISSPSALKFYAYHGHREMMYALGKYFELDFNIDFPALPKGAIPPATTIFFELHDLTDVNQKNFTHETVGSLVNKTHSGQDQSTQELEKSLKTSDDGSEAGSKSKHPPKTHTPHSSDYHAPQPRYVVRTFLWKPCYNKSTEPTSPQSHENVELRNLREQVDCPATQVQLDFCRSLDCSLHEFEQQVRRRIAKTGTWAKLCHVNRPAMVDADVQAVDTEQFEQVFKHSLKQQELVDTSIQLNPNTVSAQTIKSSSSSSSAPIVFLLLIPIVFGAHYMYKRYKSEREEYVELA